MSTIFPQVFLSEEHKSVVLEPPHLLIQYIDQYASKNLYTNKNFQNILFGLCLSCFQKLNLNQLFPKKPHKFNNTYFQDYENNLAAHNKEIERRGFKVIQTLQSQAIADNLKHIFGEEATDEKIQMLADDGMSLSEQKTILNRLVTYFTKLFNVKHLASTFQLAYIEYSQNVSLSEIQKINIIDKLEFCIKNNFLFADHFKGILILEGFFKDKTQDDAIKHFLACGKKGFSSSYCVLGELHEKTDIFKAIYYYDLAYKTGDTYAALMLGYIYLDPLLEYDDENILIPKGIKYLEYAAKKGSIDAKYMLGTVYYEDYRGLTAKTEDYEKSIFYLKDIFHEKPEALILLGHIYFKLIFNPSYYNHPLNEKYLKMNEKSFQELLNKNLFLFMHDKTRKDVKFSNHPGISIHTQYCLYYLSEGVNKDVLPCFYYLGYLFGKGVENRVNVNKEQCLSLLSKGAESGHEGCKSLLAYFKKEFNNSDQDTNTTN